MNDPAITPCLVELRPRSGLGRTKAGGLCGTHHFCFATYQRPDRLEWGGLRSFNDYRLAPGAVRDPTFHSGFDIITLVTGGALRRLGTYAPRQVLRPGSVELVSAGRGVDLGMESIGTEAATYTEIWIRTGPGLRDPRRIWSPAIPANPDGPFAQGPEAPRAALRLRTNAAVQLAVLTDSETMNVPLAVGDCVYVVSRAGEVSANRVAAGPGDGLAISGSGMVALRATMRAEFLIVRTSTG